MNHPRGSSPEEVGEGLELVQELPFAIDLVEQGHAGGQMLMRDHNDSCAALCARMGSQQVRPLTTPYESIIESLAVGRTPRHTGRLPGKQDYGKTRVLAEAHGR